MTDPVKPPIVTPIDAAADAIDDDDESHLPAHEERDARTAGGGVMSQGGTAVDRGSEEADDPDEVVPTSHLPG